MIFDRRDGGREIRFTFPQARAELLQTGEYLRQRIAANAPADTK
jgi:hypothetical protein